MQEMAKKEDGACVDTSILNGVDVLVVEDAWHTARAIKSALTELGIHVIGPAATTAGARRFVTEKRPALALVDVNLKAEMATGFIEELHRDGVPVIVMSGYATPPVAVGTVAAFLQKPFTGRELVSVMVAARLNVKSNSLPEIARPVVD
jgi:DNA-binding NtrC family response regulator